MLSTFRNSIVKLISKIKEKLRYKSAGRSKNSQIPNYMERRWSKEAESREVQMGIEYEFRKRYVNVIKEEGNFIIFLSWNKNENASDFIECSDQREAEIVMEVLKAYYWHYGSVSFRYDGVPSYLNINESNGTIVINLSPEKKDKSKEIIYCLGMEEAWYYIEKLRKHYGEYGKIIIVNEFEMEKEEEMDDENFTNDNFKV